MTESIVCRTERANPAQSIQPSVRSTITKSTRTNTSEINPFNRTDFKMRDLYNRKQKLDHWIEKAKTKLDEPLWAKKF